MSRRSSGKTGNQLPEAEPIATITTPTRQRRKVVKAEETEVVATSPVRSAKKRLRAEAVHEKENIESPKGSLETSISRIKTEAIIKEEKSLKSRKVPAKRHARTEDDEEESEHAGEKKVTKKRKTKEEKEAEAMPLAARTAIGALKKAMYIGAHVSGAGGLFT